MQHTGCGPLRLGTAACRHAVLQGVHSCTGRHLGAGLCAPGHGSHRLCAAGFQHMGHARLLGTVQHLRCNLQPQDVLLIVRVNQG